VSQVARNGDHRVVCRSLADLQRKARDLLCLVADPLELETGPRHGTRHPQVIGDRLLERDERQAVAIEACVVVVDQRFPRQHQVRELHVALKQRLDRAANLADHEPAHLHGLHPQRVQRLVHRLGRVALARVVLQDPHWRSVSRTGR
jgi:hypothetical protein